MLPNAQRSTGCWLVRQVYTPACRGCQSEVLLQPDPHTCLATTSHWREHHGYDAGGFNSHIWCACCISHRLHTLGQGSCCSAVACIAVVVVAPCPHKHQTHGILSLAHVITTCVPSQQAASTWKLERLNVLLYITCSQPCTFHDRQGRNCHCVHCCRMPSPRHPGVGTQAPSTATAAGKYHAIWAGTELHHISERPCSLHPRLECIAPYSAAPDIAPRSRPSLTPRPRPLAALVTLPHRPHHLNPRPPYCPHRPAPFPPTPSTSSTPLPSRPCLTPPCPSTALLASPPFPHSPHPLNSQHPPALAGPHLWKSSIIYHLCGNHPFSLY